MLGVEALAGDPEGGLSGLELFELEAALTNIITAGGRGQPLDPSLNHIFDGIDAEAAADRLRILLLAVAHLHREKVTEHGLVPLYLCIDEQCIKDGGRTRLQELMLGDYAAVNRLKLSAE